MNKQTEKTLTSRIKKMDTETKVILRKESDFLKRLKKFDDDILVLQKRIVNAGIPAYQNPQLVRIAVLKNKKIRKRNQIKKELENYKKRFLTRKQRLERLNSLMEKHWNSLSRIRKNRA